MAADPLHRAALPLFADMMLDNYTLRFGVIVPTEPAAEPYRRARQRVLDGDVPVRRAEGAAGPPPLRNPGRRPRSAPLDGLECPGAFDGLTPGLERGLGP